MLTNEDFAAIVAGPAAKPFKDKTCLVTGAAGFMGKYMVRLLAAEGAIIVATDLAEANPFSDLPNVIYVRCDLTDKHDIQQKLFLWGAYDYVFHIAGLFDYSASEELLKKVNVGGSQNLIHAIAASGHPPKRFVFWAAGGVYDFARGKRGEAAREGRVAQGPEVGEEFGGTPIAKLSGYLKSKYDAEMMLFQEGQKLGIPVTSIRPGGVYGPGSRYGIAIAIKLASIGGMGPFYIGPQKTRAGMIHAEDVCCAAMHVALHPAAAGEIFNVNDDSEYTTAYLMRTCVAWLGFPMLPVISLPMGAMRLFVKQLKRRAEKMGRVPILTEDMINLQELDAMLDASKLKKLGWTPRWPDSLSGLYCTITAYREEGWL